MTMKTDFALALVSLENAIGTLADILTDKALRELVVSLTNEVIRSRETMADDRC